MRALPGPERGRPDLDSLDVAGGSLDGLVDVERQTAVTLWAICGAPLYTGNDLTTLSDFGVALLTHPTILAINSHPVPAVPLSRAQKTSALTAIERYNHVAGSTVNSTQAGTATQVWVADYNNGTYTLAVFNLDPLPLHGCTLSLTAVTGVTRSVTANVTDVWQGLHLGTFVDTFKVGTVASHGVRLFTLLAV